MSFSKSLFLCFLVLQFIGCRTGVGQPPSRGFEPGYRILWDNPVQDKNFYLLSLFQQLPEVRATLLEDVIVKQHGAPYVNSFSSSINNCGGNTKCLDDALRWRSGDVRKIGKRLQELCKSRPELKAMVNKHMRPSGMFARFSNEPDHIMLLLAWEEAVEGMHHIFDVYGLGEAPYYDDIDQVGYDIQSPEYQKLVNQELKETAPQQDQELLFFEPALFYAMALLIANNRDEAGRYEPMQNKANAKAYEYIPNINWDAYPYSAILVCGASPGPSDDPPNISAYSMGRADHAVALYKEGKAPLIIFSGGHVRPFQTSYSEAIEMRKYVMEKYGIDQKHLLVDPHARHTTTNLRNGARIIWRYGIPPDKEAIVTTDATHSFLITSTVHRLRCYRELGYQPVQLRKRLSPNDVAFLPNAKSLHADSSDPLDP